MQKVDTKALLGLDKINKECAEPVYMSIKSGTKNHGYGIGLPCVTCERSIEQDKKVQIVFPFAHCYGRWPREVIRLDQKYMLRMKDQPKYATEDLRVFTKRNMEMIIDGAKSNGVMSFLMTPRAGVAFLKNLGSTLDLFKYHTVHSLCTRNHKEVLCHPGDSVLPILTVFDLPLCVPVFNKRRAEGIGFNYELVLPRSSQKRGGIATFACLSMILCQFRDNVFRIDGVSIRNQVSLGCDTVAEYIDMTKTEIKAKKANIIKPKVKKGDSYTLTTRDYSSTYASSTTSHFQR